MYVLRKGNTLSNSGKSASMEKAATRKDDVKLADQGVMTNKDEDNKLAALVVTDVVMENESFGLSERCFYCDPVSR